MEILGIIPARGGSKGIPRKNLRPILGKPLIAYTIEASLKSKYITKTILTTEDSEIAQSAKTYGAEVIERPMHLALDEVKTAPVIKHALIELEKQGYRPDYIVLLQPTCPLRDEQYIDAAFDFYFENQKKGFDSCFSAFEAGKTHALWKKCHNQKMQALYDFRKRPRRQDNNEHYDLICENGAFYALSYEKFLLFEDFIGHNPCVYLTKRVIDIDVEDDFKKIEEELKNKNV